MITGIYVGSDKQHLNETALIREVDDDLIDVQFDRFDHPMSHGWHTFLKSDFKIFEKVTP